MKRLAMVLLVLFGCEDTYGQQEVMSTNGECTTYLVHGGCQTHDTTYTKCAGSRRVDSDTCRPVCVSTGKSMVCNNVCEHSTTEMVP